MGLKTEIFNHHSHSLNEPRHEKNCLMPYANNKGADQPAHPRSPISAFVVRSLDSIMPAVATVKLLNSDAQKICYNHPKI